MTKLDDLMKEYSQTNSAADAFYETNIKFEAEETAPSAVDEYLQRCEIYGSAGYYAFNRDELSGNKLEYMGLCEDVNSVVDQIQNEIGRLGGPKIEISKRKSR